VAKGYIERKARPHGYRLGELTVARDEFLKKTNIPFNWSDKGADAADTEAAAKAHAVDDGPPF